MMDMSLTARTRLVAGARVERFEQEVTSFDPFGLFVSTITSRNENTDVFPSVNLVQGSRCHVEPAPELQRHRQPPGVP